MRKNNNSFKVEGDDENIHSLMVVVEEEYNCCLVVGEVEDCHNWVLKVYTDN